LLRSKAGIQGRQYCAAKRKALDGGDILLYHNKAGIQGRQYCAAKRKALDGGDI
jgi:hypothetical protein